MVHLHILETAYRIILSLKIRSVFVIFRFTNYKLIFSDETHHGWSTSVIFKERDAMVGLTKFGQNRFRNS